MGGVEKTHFSHNFVAACLRGAFWINFGGILGAKMLQNGGQEGSKRVLKSKAYFDRFLGGSRGDPGSSDHAPVVVKCLIGGVTGNQTGRLHPTIGRLQATKPPGYKLQRLQIYKHGIYKGFKATNKALHGTARHGTAWHGMARHGTARHGTARHGIASYGTARHRTTRHRMTSVLVSIPTCTLCT